MPKWYSNTAAIIAFRWNTLHSVCTIRKLKFLHRVTTIQESICHRAFSATVDDIESLSLVKECRELEQRYKSNFTSTILCAHGEDGLDIFQNAQKSIFKIDQSLLLQKASEYPFLTQIARCTGWKRLWDDALDYGLSVIKGLKNLVQVITYPSHFLTKCPLCDILNLAQLTLTDHIIVSHTNSEKSWYSLLDSCSMNPNCFNHILCLYIYFRFIFFVYFIFVSLPILLCMSCLGGPTTLTFELLLWHTTYVYWRKKHLKM